MGEEWKSTRHGNQWDVAVMESLMWAWKAFEWTGPALRQRGTWMAGVINIKGTVSSVKATAARSLGNEVVGSGDPRVNCVWDLVCPCPRKDIKKRKWQWDARQADRDQSFEKSSSQIFSSVLIGEVASCRPRTIMKLITKRQGCQEPYTSLVSSSVKPELFPQDFF